MKDEQKIRYTKHVLASILVRKYQELADVSDEYTKKLLDLGMDEDDVIETVQMIADQALSYVNAEC